MRYRRIGAGRQRSIAVALAAFLAGTGVTVCGPASAQTATQPNGAATVPSIVGPSFGTTTRTRMSSEQIRAIQRALNRAGFSPGAIDGVWGQHTQGALKDFQQARGLQASGRPNPTTLQALGVGADHSGAGVTGGTLGVPGELPGGVPGASTSGTQPATTPGSANPAVPNVATPDRDLLAEPPMAPDRTMPGGGIGAPPGGVDTIGPAPMGGTAPGGEILRHRPMR